MELRENRNEARTRLGHRHLFAGLMTLVALFSLPVGAEEVITIAPGPEGEDVSYYSFIPSLNRGEYTTMYAHTADDEQGISHDMRTFIRFPLPVDLLGPEETVIEAFLVMVFAFTFDHSGAPPVAGGELSLHEVTEEWEEATLNFSNHPASGAPFGSMTGIDELGSLFFDVTESVRDWAHGQTDNYGFMLSNPNDQPIGFHTFEAEVDPSLKSRLIIRVPEPTGLPVLLAGIVSLAMRVCSGRRKA